MMTVQERLENKSYNCESSLYRSLISNREKQVLKLISQGDTTTEIAASLYISPHTVITHRKHLLAKLNVRNTAHLVMRGVKLGLL